MHVGPDGLSWAPAQTLEPRREDLTLIVLDHLQRLSPSVGPNQLLARDSPKSLLSEARATCCLHGGLQSPEGAQQQPPWSLVEGALVPPAQDPLSRDLRFIGTGRCSASTGRLRGPEAEGGFSTSAARQHHLGSFENAGGRLVRPRHSDGAVAAWPDAGGWRPSSRVRGAAVLGSPHPCASCLPANPLLRGRFTHPIPRDSSPENLHFHLACTRMPMWVVRSLEHI